MGLFIKRSIWLTTMLFLFGMVMLIIGRPILMVVLFIFLLFGGH